MIRLENLYKSYFIRGVERVVADGINITFPSKVSVGLLGRNGTGKSSLLSMIGGTMSPSSGRIVTDGTISWPVGFSGSFNGELTGAQNVRFIARVYGVDSEELVDFVADFAEVGRQYHEPVRTYSSGMRSRLAFGLSMGVRFDTYLVDEVTGAGDARFRHKSLQLFLSRMQDSGAVFVSHGMDALRRFCTAGAVLERGRLIYFDDLEEAIARHHRNLHVAETYDD
jgi:capsular polysaccharide transport system ATP-binding protein